MIDSTPATSRARNSANRGIAAGKQTQPVAAHVVHAIAILRGLGRSRTRPLSDIEAEALAVIYRSYAGMLLNVLRQLLGDGASAEDVLHDVFCRLPWAISQYRDNSFGGWLRQLTVRTALSQMRAARRRREFVIPEPDFLITDRVSEIDFHALEDREVLARAIARLPEPLRQVVVLRVIMDFSHQQIGEALEISATASEVRMCRALKHLRFLMREEIQDRAAGHA